MNQMSKAHIQCYSPKICPIPIDEVAPFSVTWDVMTPAEHGGQHGVVESPQRGQASSEVHAPNIQRDDLWKLLKGNGNKIGKGLKVYNQASGHKTTACYTP